MIQNKPWTQHQPNVLHYYQVDLSSLRQNTAELLDHAVEKYATASASTICFPHGLTCSLNFQQVAEYSGALANYLQGELKIQAGDVVGLMMLNTLHYAIAAFACWKVGAILTNINPMYTARELQHQLLDSSAKALIISNLFIPTFEKALNTQEHFKNISLITTSFTDFFVELSQITEPEKFQQLEAQYASLNPPSITHHSFQQAIEIGRSLMPYQTTHSPIAMYQYTGGTTGRSKGTIISHQNLNAMTRMVTDNLNAYELFFNQEDTVLTVIPLYHAFAFTINFLTFFEAGTQSILIPSPRPIDNLKPAFEKYQITWLTGVDTLYTGLLNSDWFMNKPQKIKCAFSGGTTLRPTTAKLWQDKISPILEGYGMTECTAGAITHPPIQDVRHSSVGFPFPGCEIRIIDDEGNDLGVNQEGEILVRGPHVAQGYLNQAEETATTFKDGWLHTGDIGLMREDGFFYIIDRKKDMILVSGFNVFPNEIEAIISEIPKVLEVAVVGVANEKTGESVKAYITRTCESLTVQEIIKYCQENMTAYKVPKSIEFLTELPKSTVGKILRAELRTR